MEKKCGLNSKSKIKIRDTVKILNRKDEKGNLSAIAVKIKYLFIHPMTEEFVLIHHLVDESLQDIGFEPSNFIEDKKDFLSYFFTAVEQADLVIADVTGNNPNVMYEIGYAHALKKPMLFLLREDAMSIPTPLGNYLMLIYDNIELQNSVTFGIYKDKIQKWAKNGIKQFFSKGDLQ